MAIQISNWVTELQKRTNLQGTDRILMGISDTGESLYTTVADLAGVVTGSTVVNRGNWASGTQYTQGDYVFAESTASPSDRSMYFLIGTNPYVSNIPPKDDLSKWSELPAIKGDQGPQGPKGDKGDPLTWDDLTPAQKESLKGDVGDSGWSMLVRAEVDNVNLDSDGQYRKVLYVYDWVGGEGTKPTITGYIGVSGIVANIINAENWRGSRGAQGLKGDAPAHEWVGTSIRFQNPNGTWGALTDLRGVQGLQGIKGDPPAHGWNGTSLRFQNPDGSWGAYVDLKGEKGEMGEGLQIDASGPFSGRSAYDSEPVNFIYWATDEGLFYIRANPTGWSTGQSLGSVANFLQLDDTPSSYTGSGGKVVAVKSDASGLEFINKDWVNTTSSQTNISGSKEWLGVHTYKGAAGRIRLWEPNGTGVYYELSKNAENTRSGFFGYSGTSDHIGITNTIVEGRIILTTSTGVKATFFDNGSVQFPALSGTGFRMVTASATGVLSSQAIPLGIATGGTTDQILAKSSNVNGATKWVSPDWVKLTTNQTISGIKTFTSPVKAPNAVANDDLVTLSQVNTRFNSLAEVASSGDYDDLSNKPTIPDAQVNSDWNATSGVEEILNKPTIPAAQVSSDWTASSGIAQILNKPTLGTASSKNVGTGVGNVVEVQAGGKLPALDGSQLTNLPIPASSMVKGYRVFTSGSELVAEDDGMMLQISNTTQVSLANWASLPIGFTVFFVRSPVAELPLPTFTNASGINIFGDARIKSFDGVSEKDPAQFKFTKTHTNTYYVWN